MFDYEVEHGFSLPYSLRCSNTNKHLAHWDRPRGWFDQQAAALAFGGCHTIESKH